MRIDFEFYKIIKYLFYYVLILKLVLYYIKYKIVNDNILWTIIIFIINTIFLIISVLMLRYNSIYYNFLNDTVFNIDLLINFFVYFCLAIIVSNIYINKNESININNFYFDKIVN